MHYAVYIMANQKRGITYVGVTNSLSRRYYEHTNGIGSKFVQKFKLYHLVFVEYFESPNDAIAAEKRIKKWHKDWKFQMIEQMNPNWEDLAQYGF